MKANKPLELIRRVLPAAALLGVALYAEGKGVKEFDHFWQSIGGKK